LLTAKITDGINALKPEDEFNSYLKESTTPGHYCALRDYNTCFLVSSNYFSKYRVMQYY
jgi:hypothetical protein